MVYMNHSLSNHSLNSSITERLMPALVYCRHLSEKYLREFREAWHINQNYYSGKKRSKALFCKNSRPLLYWAYLVKQRDGFKCKKCDDIDVLLHAHHIKNRHNFPLLQLDIDNGITLCKYCHLEFHLKYAKYNNNITQLDEFLSLR
jgi:hypothetical protein